MAYGDFIEVIETDANFDAEVLKSPLSVLVDFGAAWCGPDRQLRPILDQIGQDFQGQVRTCSIDIDNCPETTRKYGVRSVPTVLIFKGGEKVATSVGLTSRENLIKLLGL